MANQWFNTARAKLGTTAAMLCCSPLLIAAEEAVQEVEKTLPPSNTEQLLKMVLGLMFVLLLIFALAWMMRRFGAMGFGGNGSLRAVAGVSVGQKERVVLLQVGERQILVGVAPGQVNMLHAIEKGDELDVSQDKPAAAQQFSEKLKASMSRFEKQ